MMDVNPVVTAKRAAPYAYLLDTRPWYKNTRLIILNCWITVLLMSSITTGYDGSMMNGLQSLTQWNQALDYPTKGRLGLLSAIQPIGTLCALPFAAYMVDELGRRAPVLFGSCLIMVATAIQTASQSMQMFIGARFLNGFGLTFIVIASPILITELAYPSHRGEATSLYNTILYVGSIIAAWITYGTSAIPTNWSWRIPSALQAISSMIQISLIWFVPESPRWLVGKGREEHALQILAYYHADGNVQDPLVEYEFEEIKAAIALDREVAANVGWLSLIKNPGNRKRMRIIVALGVFSQWSGSSLVTFYLNKVFTAIGITNPTTQLMINGFLNIFNLIVAVSSGLCCERVGRRPLFLTSCVGIIIFWAAQTVTFSHHQESGSIPAAHATIVFIFLFFASYNIGFSPLIISYTVEILPYTIRAKGYTVFYFTFISSLIFSEYVNPIALAALQWKYYLVYLFWQCFELVFCYFFIVETKNHTLEETAAIFDGDGVAEIRDKAIAHTGSIQDHIEDKETMSKVPDLGAR